MSGVPIGILIAVIIMIVPIYKILRANHVLFKYRVAWLLVTAFGIAGGLYNGYRSDAGHTGGRHSASAGTGAYRHVALAKYHRYFQSAGGLHWPSNCSQKA